MMTARGCHSRIRYESHWPAGRHPSGRPGAVCAGFSLIELLIVLAILTAVSALVLPSLRRPLNQARLRSATVQVQNALGKARSLAVRQGRAVAFRCETGGRRWRIERADSMSAGRFGADDAAAVGTGSLSFGQTADASGSLLREGRLPEAVTFGPLTVRTPPVPSEPETPAGEPDDGLFGEEPAGDRTVWSDPILFEPQGRSRDARLRLDSAGGLASVLVLRGLTGSVRVSVPFRPHPSIDDSELSDELSADVSEAFSEEL